MSTRRHLEYDPSNGRRCLKTARVSPELRKIAGIRRALAMGVLILTVCFGFPAQISAQTVEESRVKAAYLYNFAKFVEWPSGVFRNPDDPTVICVVGDERISDVLEPAVSGKKANGRPVEARRPRSSDEFKSCHVLFIGFSDKERITQLLNRLQRSSVLTVGQSDQFIRLGGMINLALKNTTVELEIDPEASNAVGLKISSRLLVVARLVKAPDQAGGER
jgi:YfiR/HmsC-like